MVASSTYHRQQLSDRHDHWVTTNLEFVLVTDIWWIFLAAVFLATVHVDWHVFALSLSTLAVSEWAKCGAHFWKEQLTSFTKLSDHLPAHSAWTSGWPDIGAHC